MQPWVMDQLPHLHGTRCARACARPMALTVPCLFISVAQVCAVGLHHPGAGQAPSVTTEDKKLVLPMLQDDLLLGSSLLCHSPAGLVLAWYLALSMGL